MCMCVCERASREKEIERFDDAVMMPLKREEGAMGQGMQTA